MANSNNWGEIYKSTWWGDKAWSANTLFIDSAPPGFGLNLLKGSEDLDNTIDWKQVLSSVVANSTDEAAPNSTDTAEKITFTADRQSRIQQQIDLEANTTYTFSVYAKVRTGTKAFRLRNSTLGQAQQFTADTSWGLNPDDGRYSFSFTTGATAITHTLSIQNAAAGGSGEVFFWGAMLNEGATAGDYVKTEASVSGSAPTPAYSGFGDAFGGVTAYYSLRQFTEAETLNAIRVRRSSDDTEQDIGFNANGDLDTTALLAFVGTGGTDNGYVTTFYDQSGNGNNATNSTESEQPLVVSGGTLVEENGKAAIDFDGVDDYLTLGGTNDAGMLGDISVFSVNKNSISGNSVVVSTGLMASSYAPSIQWGLNGGVGVYTGTTSDGTTRINENVTTANYGSQVLVSMINDEDGNLQMFADGVGSTGQTAVAPMNDANFALEVGRDSGGQRYYFEGTQQELILFDSDQSSNRGTVTTGGGTGIEGNINTYFDIV